MTKAEVEYYNGEPAIIINGKAFPPMMITTKSGDLEYLKKLGESGLRIFYVDSAMRWNQPGNELESDGVTDTFRRIAQLKKAVPGAYVFLRLNVNPSVEWINSHPEEQLLYSDGSHQRVICTSAGKQPVDGMVSFASELWREEGAKAIADFLAEISQNPLFDSIVGVFLCAGGTSEWYYPGFNLDAKGLYADFSKPFRKSYSDFLRKKYGTELELRRVWNRQDATFEAPVIPDMEDRYFIYESDKQAVKELKEWEIAARKIQDDSHHCATNVGCFLDANHYMHTADFFEALHQATADTIIRFAKTFKKITPNLLVGAFYGGFACTDYCYSSNCTGVLSIMDCGCVDFLATPGVYNNREPGGVVAQREAQDSFRIRKQIFISEDDSRTHRSLPSVQKESMHLYTVDDSVNTLKRDFARDICEDIQGWWFDMGAYKGRDWYDDEKILSLFKRQQEIGAFAYGLNRKKHNEIALIYDIESVHLVSQYTSQLVLDFFRTSDIHRIGAPVDYYFHNDMSHPGMPDYKLYVILNAYRLTDGERDVIFKKAARNHAVVLWLYAPGFVNPDSEPIMGVANIEKTVGMKLRMNPNTGFPWFHIDPKTHPIVKKAKADRRYGGVDREVHSNIWISRSELLPDFTNPAFIIEEDEDVKVLGRYCADSEPALAMKEYNGFLSVYCCTQVLRSDVIASIAEYAGCHIYTDSEDVLYANDNFVAIHASFDGKRRIYFKKTCSPYELYEKRYYGKNVNHIDVEMNLGETKMFYQE